MENICISFLKDKKITRLERKIPKSRKMSTLPTSSGAQASLCSWAYITPYDSYLLITQGSDIPLKTWKTSKKCRLLEKIEGDFFQNVDYSGKVRDFFIFQIPYNKVACILSSGGPVFKKTFLRPFSQLDVTIIMLNKNGVRNFHVECTTIKYDNDSGKFA